MEQGVRDIGGHRYRRQTSLFPRLHLAAGLAKHPLVHRADQSRINRRIQEDPGRHEAAFRMFPSHQRFSAQYFSGMDVEFGLIVDDEFLAFQRAPEIAFEVQPFGGGGIEARRIELAVVSALLLGVVHRRVGIFQEGLHRRAVRGIDGNADAGGDKDFVPVDDERMGQRVEDSTRHPAGIFRVRERGQENGEFISAQAGERVGWFVVAVTLTESLWRTDSLSRSATWVSKRSPTVCPNVSLMTLKRSKSINSVARCR